MHLLIPAAGMGRRMGSDRNKLRLALLGKPLLAWTLMAAETAESIQWIGLIGQPEDWPDWETIIAKLAMKKPVQLIRGGITRQESVYNSLQALPPEAEKVLIHDGARCLGTSKLIDRCADAMANHPGLVAAVPVKDTIKVVGEAGFVQSTPNRNQLWAAQTPQGFEVRQLKQCHQSAQDQGLEVTDDAALFERFNLPVYIVPGEETNLKLTTPTDLAIAELVLRRRFEQRPIDV